MLVCYWGWIKRLYFRWQISSIYRLLDFFIILLQAPPIGGQHSPIYLPLSLVGEILLPQNQLDWYLRPWKGSECVDHLLHSLYVMFFFYYYFSSYSRQFIPTPIKFSAGSSVGSCSVSSHSHLQPASEGSRPPAGSLVVAVISDSVSGELWRALLCSWFDHQTWWQ